MISLNKVNKFYNKGKQNEIHVINNTSLAFPETGLVALTGPSGCGKTTLLNVIGGLDGFNSGNVQFEGVSIKRYHPYEWDSLRNKYIGYIFQNYNLILNKTVYENVEIALNMSGLYDKNEIEERINYVLKTVGMYNYRKRNVQALSGGQQQRVAIARAIAKNPKVVLADEPTGNLDANNTFEIMSIIKKISAKCLVILVSHEKELVDFYADRVIELFDGKIIDDYENIGNRSFKHIDEREIYLKDLKEDTTLKDNGIDYYYDDKKDDTLGIKIVELRDSIYIKASAAKKIKYLSSDTEIKFIDDHYKEKKTNDVDEYDFNMDKFGPIETKGKKKSFIRLWEAFKQGFIKTTSRGKFIGKLFIVAYFVISALVVYQLASFGSLTRIDEKDFLTTGRNLIQLDSTDGLTATTVDDILDGVEGVDFSPYFASVFCRFEFYDYYQGNVNVQFTTYPMKESWIDENDLVLGRMPENNLEMVIDEWIADKIINDKSMTDLNVTDVTELLGNYIYTSGTVSYKFEIVGIVQTESPIVVVQDDAILSFLDDTSQYIPEGTANNRVTLTEGRNIASQYEIMVSDGAIGYEINDSVLIDGTTYIIVGKFDFADNPQNKIYFSAVIPNEAIMDNIKTSVGNSDFFYRDYYGVFFYSANMNTSLQQIRNLDMAADNAYELQHDSFVTIQRQQFASRVQTVVIVLAGVIIYIFFMMRSSMLNRIKEIGIYRSIGASKLDIYKIFLGEIIAFTTIGSLTGYLAMTALLLRIQHMLGDLVVAFYLPWYYFLGGILVIYIINIIFGMLPIYTLLKKTPSEINTKYDI